MIAAGRQDDSEPGTIGLDLAVLRASLRCGRSLPVRHLVESDEAFEQRHYSGDPIVLCGAEVTEPSPDAQDLDCPGCRDCLRYCPDCVREAHRFSAEATCDRPIGAQLPDPAPAAPDGEPEPAS